MTPFDKRLAELGYADFQAYQADTPYRKRRDDFRTRHSKPMACFVCREPECFAWRNGRANVGAETLDDFVALCQECFSLAGQMRKHSSCTLREAYIHLAMLSTLRKRESNYDKLKRIVYEARQNGKNPYCSRCSREVPMGKHFCPDCSRLLELLRMEDGQ